MDIPVIRPFQEQDLPAVSSIYQRARASEFAGEGDGLEFAALSDDPDMLGMFRQSLILVFVEGGVIKGFVGYVHNYIAWLYVDPDYWRQGIAHQMLAYVLRALNKMPTLKLSLLASNQAARACYEKYGFRKSETFEFEFQGRTMQGIRMLRFRR